jgi:glycosyltransferase involved in cell wall biosynthesis
MPAQFEAEGMDEEGSSSVVRHSSAPFHRPSSRAWPRISIVTPSYNQAQFIEETIRSVLLQGYPNLEYIIIDGGSDDGSVEIIRKYEPWLAYWVSEPDRGQSHAINKGFDQATGEILAWLNSDDIYMPDALENVREPFSDPEIDLVYGDAHKIDATGNFIGKCGHVQVYRRELMTKECNIIVQPAAFFRRSAFERVGGLDETLNNVMDYDLWFRLGDKGGVKYLPVMLAKARIYAETKTGSTGRKRFEEIEKVARRYGARRLPAAWRRELAITHMGLAVERYQDQGPKGAWGELSYVIDKAPVYGLKQRWALKNLFKALLGSEVIRIVKRFVRE